MANVVSRNSCVLRTAHRKKKMDDFRFDSNMFLLTQVYAVSIFSFAFTFAVSLRWVQRYHETHRVPHSREVSIIKLNVKLLRIVLFWLLLLQYPLLTHALKHPDRKSSFETLIRPVGGCVVLGFGFVVNSHPMFRWIFGLSAFYLVVFDTASEVILDNDIACFQRGRSCSGRNDTVELTMYYMWRDLLAIGAELWCLLQVSYLCIAIGSCSSRYSARLLSTSVPQRNIREILEFYHPRV